MDISKRLISLLPHVNRITSVYWLMAYWTAVVAAAGLANGICNRETDQETFFNCLAKTGIDISYPRNDTWWYDSQHGISISPRSGGHSHEAFSAEDDHLIIDVSRITFVEINPVSADGLHSASIGAGIRMGRLYYELGQRRVTFVGGESATVALAGLIAAGGYSLSIRKWGITADHVLQLEMVDYSGRVIVANNSTNPDLFFALRGGGGGSYGIVVKVDFRVIPYPKRTTTFTVDWDEPIKMSEWSKAWFKWAPWRTMPDEMSFYLYLKKEVHMQGMYVGDDGPDGLKRILEDSGFLTLGPVGSQRLRYYSSEDNLEARAWLDNGGVHYGDARDYHFYNSPTSFVFKGFEVPPYPEVVHETLAQIQRDPRVNRTHRYGSIGTTGVIEDMEPNLIDRQYTKHSTQIYAKEFDDTAIKAIEEFIGYDGNIIEMMPYGGILHSIPHDFNAYAHRSAPFASYIFVSYHPIGTHRYSGVAGQSEVLQKLLIALEPFSSGGSYPGVPDLFWSKDPKLYMPRYYGNHTMRLVHTKRKYDPDNCFNNAQSTPTTF